MVGYGTTNTGNVARRCFDEPEKFADACGLDREFFTNIATILRCYRSKFVLDFDAVERLSHQTYRQHFTLYPWARMNPTTHKILIHGPEIGRHFPLPLSFLAEDGQEAWHKYYRQNLVGHSRQDSREHRIMDTYNAAIYATDPFVTLSTHDEDKDDDEEIPEMIKQYVLV